MNLEGTSRWLSTQSPFHSIEWKGDCVDNHLTWAEVICCCGKPGRQNPAAENSSSLPNLSPPMTVKGSDVLLVLVSITSSVHSSLPTVTLNPCLDDLHRSPFSSHPPQQASSRAAAVTSSSTSSCPCTSSTIYDFTASLITLTQFTHSAALAMFPDSSYVVDFRWET